MPGERTVSFRTLDGLHLAGTLSSRRHRPAGVLSSCMVAASRARRAGSSRASLPAWQMLVSRAVIHWAGGCLYAVVPKPAKHLCATGIVTDVVGDEQAGLTKATEHPGGHGAVCRDAFVDAADLRAVVGDRELADPPQTGGGQVAEAHYRAARASVR
jgi:hypothetical protein